MDIETAEQILKSAGINPSQIDTVDLLSRGLFQIYEVKTRTTQFVIKQVLSPSMMRAESSALKLLHDHSVPVPECLFALELSGKYYLLMEKVPSGTHPSDSGLYQTLLTLYSIKGERWGWEGEDYIGNLPRMNQYYSTFTESWIDGRILPQLTLARENRQIDSKVFNQVKELCIRLCEVFELNDCSPVLIHGDLWAGNVLYQEGGRAVLIDPAISYGNPEQDFGMSLLFGGFPGEAWIHSLCRDLSIPPGWEDRVSFWQIYPILVHINIFGSSYVSQLKRLLDDCKKYIS